MCADCGLKRSSFGLPSEKRKRWCGPCAKAYPGAINIYSRRCEDCMQHQPSFGLPEDRKLRWCVKCSRKHPGAMNVEKRRCEVCKQKQPSFGMPAEGRKRWCDRPDNARTVNSSPRRDTSVAPLCTS